ncbi:hypothetical protein [Gallaecimonas xiamenensis]|uniref:hypothetical protein n=1 Tax=Gallaecimonas xiamenensis TaxID=1207039 RepID=UPI0004B0A2BF|nr:hypothetical protein [Gallaecimonas xiamenensis]
MARPKDRQAPLPRAEERLDQELLDARLEDEGPDFSEEMRSFCPARDRDYGPLER